MHAAHDPRSYMRLHAPLYELFNQIPAVCFTLAILTDIAYWQTANLLWQNFSSWLLFAGLVGGGLTAVAVAADYFRIRRLYSSVNPYYPLGAAFVWVTALVNSLIHAGDGWTAVVPWGLTLSILTFVLMLVTSYVGGPFVHVHEE